MDFNSNGADTANSSSQFSADVDEFESDDLFFEYAKNIPDEPPAITLDNKLLEKPIRNISRAEKIQNNLENRTNHLFSPIVYFDIETTGLGEVFFQIIIEPRPCVSFDG